MSDNGLKAAGYVYVNTDDCWMMVNRSADGRQVPDPVKFPNGWLPVTSAIHALGMKAGLYTSKSPYTCAKFNASCGKEVIDAQTYASWEIDYVKEVSACVRACSRLSIPRPSSSHAASGSSSERFSEALSRFPPPARMRSPHLFLLSDSPTHGTPAGFVWSLPQQ